MKTQHVVHVASASELRALPRASVELVVTSPPYPMIEMWDAIFAAQDPAILQALEGGDGWSAFEKMHKILDRVWRQVSRVLAPGGIACINIGDATRTVSGQFALYPNHSRILTSLVRLGLQPLPAIVWRKQTNAPNKFMGSGMLPAGAYVTLEHEFVLVLRKGDKRAFLTDESKSHRRQSALFWEERNQWYSDVWFDLKGTTQGLADKKTRERSGAFPFELPYRLINMFSVKGDTVVDPFFGTGTTMLAAMAAARNSVGYELDAAVIADLPTQAAALAEVANARISERLQAHSEFIRARYEAKGRFGYRNTPYGFPVVTRQEVELMFSRPQAVLETGENQFEVEYLQSALDDDVDDWEWFFEAGEVPPPPDRRSGKKDDFNQRELFTEATQVDAGEKAG